MTQSRLRVEDVRAQIRHGNIQPVYLLYGEEDFLQERLERELIERLLPAEAYAFDLDRFYGPEAEWERVIAACRAVPVLAERRVVVLRQMQALSGVQRLRPYLEHPNPRAVLLLRYDGQPNFAQDLYRILREKAVILECRPLPEQHLYGWVREEARIRGRDIEPEAVALLVDYVGTNLRALDQELEKLCIYVDASSVITAEDVENVVGHSREHTVFELQKAIGQGNFTRAYGILERRLRHSGTALGEALMILSWLGRYFLNLGKLHELAQMQASEEEMSRQTGINRYFLKDYLGDLRRYPEARVERALLALEEADAALKTGHVLGPLGVLERALRIVENFSLTDRR
ncbi:MAG: DNA polymerase III subunit delta [Bacteroidetes bacterium]|nr:DNA polymerase III subunit delta [Rhodothermia bacterium]MCS7154889.1 DNA polymerase III subunit delta [Bacteroidota bacterium]MCX7906952.1 DNA polymerase III subunit delta [Bacteroidota bacterium]MDW8137684.1 DNA polymerase III subunit delta [Bacteroidota bacterium]MDW8285362.1 DNA polymerase III subunit delta [Bacteroidota bacterium]